MSKGAVILAGQSVAASATKTCIEITAAATKLVAITRIRVSQSTHKTDEQYQCVLQRVTTSGTGTAYTPLLNEPNSGAVGMAVEINSTVEPTYTASTVLLQFSWNSKAGRDIVLTPEQYIWVAPSALVGLKIVAPAGTTTFTPDVEVHVLEVG